ncbi:MarR family winged helix-turn-helix transcriptional regulator [Pseudoduganella lutea]|uniref:MarR family transcriptional regulator n=1 Tax=Pseudoduganella lutea TaxID=321985 RepID=A0A4P6L500_9BURK|nr:MarR family transcriptional regulator [Pseudoduganella lutea]QBE66577.1 MarR family transcriptional regulator [Pseudoduganella lutea]
MPLQNDTPGRPSGLAYLVGRLDHVLSRRLRESLAPLGLTVTQYTALSVFRAQGSLSNAQLAERTMVSPQSANEMVKAMEGQGWIERRPDPSHGRIIQISLTIAGHAVMERCDAEVVKLEARMFAGLTAEERGALHGALRGAVRALNDN